MVIWSQYWHNQAASIYDQWYLDTLLLGVRCQFLGTTSIIIEYSYYSTVQDAIVATAEAVIVRLDSNGQDKKPWTNEERERLLALEATFRHTPQF